MTPPVRMTPALLRLMTWLSPSFPVGAFSYSHGLEYAVDQGLVHDAGTLTVWIQSILQHGNGRADAIFLRIAYEAIAINARGDLTWVIERAAVMRGTAETSLETVQQGRAFMDAVGAVWPHPKLKRVVALAEELDRPVTYPVAVAAASASADIPLRPCLAAFLHAMAASFVSAGVRLIPLGQTDGLRVIAALEQDIMRAVDDAMAAQRQDLGTATPMVDWASMCHETQYTRLFRS